MTGDMKEDQRRPYEIAAERLGRGLNELHEVLFHLEDRLGPVLTPEAPSIPPEERPENWESRSKIVEDAEEKVRRVGALIDRMNTLIQRVEV
jgi:hypothetical protein